MRSTNIYIYKEILLSDDISFQMPNASPYMHDIGKDIWGLDKF